MDTPSPILTIGYGARSMPELVDALQAAGVEYLVDVRSAPYSKFKPKFSKRALAAELEGHGIRYVFMGDSLGGKPDDPQARDASGRVDYERLRLRPAFHAGLESLEAGWEGGCRIALMCSEGKPQECHRTKLVAEELVANGVPVAHIDEKGEIRSHGEIMAMITDGQETLFGGHAAASRSRKRVA
jgi:uncharacterized protein (DUF488 family)